MKLPRLCMSDCDVPVYFHVWLHPHETTTLCRVVDVSVCLHTGLICCEHHCSQ